MHTKKRLVMLSIVLYLLSLFLPSMNGQPGVVVLFFGMALGWMGILFGMAFGWIGILFGGLAVYANVFYWFSIVQMLRGKQPKQALNWCVVLSAFTLLPGAPDDRLAIGWGVPVWLAALWLPWALGLVGETPEKLRYAAKIWGGVSIGILLAVFAYGRWQYADLSRNGNVSDWLPGTILMLNVSG